jgi:hypothetical protein
MGLLVGTIALLLQSSGIAGAATLVQVTPGMLRSGKTPITVQTQDRGASIQFTVTVDAGKVNADLQISRIWLWVGEIDKSTYDRNGERKLTRVFVIPKDDLRTSECTITLHSDAWGPVTTYLLNLEEISRALAKKAKTIR